MKAIVIIIQSLKGIKKYDFDKDIISIGRAKENDIVLDDPIVSSFHASLTYDPSINLYVLMDLDSKNGTFIGENKIEKPFPIERPILILIGKNKLQVFPVEMKGGSKTVVFDIDDLKKTINETIGKEIENEKVSTVKIEKKEIKNKILWKIIFLEGEHKGKVIDIEEGKKEIYFGRSQECDIVFKDQRISRKHFKLTFKNENCHITNLKPINPVYLNGKELKVEDKIVPANSIIEVQNEKIMIENLARKAEKTKELPKELELEITSPQENITCYKIRGPLNIDYYYKLENNLLSNLPKKKWAILDFSDLTLIDYPALSSILKVIAEYNQIGGEIVLINVSQELEKTFELVNVSRYLSKFKKKDIDEAIKYLSSKNSLNL